MNIYLVVKTFSFCDLIALTSSMLQQKKLESIRCQPQKTITIMHPRNRTLLILFLVAYAYPMPISSRTNERVFRRRSSWRSKILKFSSQASLHIRRRCLVDAVCAMYRCSSFNGVQRRHEPLHFQSPAAYVLHTKASQGVPRSAVALTRDT